MLLNIFKVMSYAAELSRQETVRHSVSRSRFSKYFQSVFKMLLGNFFSSHAQTLIVKERRACSGITQVTTK